LNPSWNDFKEVLFQRYGGKERSFVFEKLAKIKQKGSVEAFIQEFELLISKAPNMMEE